MGSPSAVCIPRVLSFNVAPYPLDVFALGIRRLEESVDRRLAQVLRVDLRVGVLVDLRVAQSDCVAIGDGGGRYLPLSSKGIVGSRG